MRDERWKNLPGMTGWRIAAHRRFMMKKNAKRLEKCLAAALNWTPEHSARAIAETLADAGEVPYYAEIAKGLPSRGRVLEEFPILMRGNLRNDYDRMVHPEGGTPPTYKSATGGSTGEPVTVLHDAVFALWVRATEHYYFREHVGIEPDGVPKVVFWAATKYIWGAKKPWRKKLNLFLTQTSLLSASVFSRRDFEAAVAAINSRKPVLVSGYGSCLYHVARHIRANNLKVHQPRFVASTAETLHPEMRAVIEEVFGASVFDFYGTREVGPVSGQCARGRMHLFPWMTHVEVLDDNGQPTATGGTGRVVVTSLRNACMPILRYDLGDLAGVAAERCDCGSAHPVLGTIGGRTLDYFRLRDGTLLFGGYFVRMLQSRPWLEEFRIVQREPEVIEVLYVPRGATPVPDEDRLDIEAKARLVLGEGGAFRLTPVDSLPPTADGKRIYMVGLGREG